MRYPRCFARIVQLAVLVVGVAGCAVASPSDVAPAGPNSAAVTSLQRRVEQLRRSHLLDDVWFRLEVPGREPAQVATSGRAGAVLPVASISKSVTGIGIALLIQEGKLALTSKLGDLLSDYFTERGAVLDESLRDVTIARLLSHRAGLQTNVSTDPLNGLSSGTVIQSVGGYREFFRYLDAAKRAKSNGSTEFAYSNLSYLLLGAVIEAVSKEKYVDFCQKHIFRPLGIQDATIPTAYTIVAPFAGWHLSMADVLRVWGAFDVTAPTLLTRDTLNKTLLGRIEPPIDTNGRVYYLLGANILQPNAGGSYVVNHNGIADFIAAEAKTYTFVEEIPQASAWVVVFDAGRRTINGTERRDINNDIRAIVKDVVAGG